jgi:hypothetical protein
VSISLSSHGSICHQSRIYVQTFRLMLITVFFGLGITLQGLLLVRGLSIGVGRSFPAFYSYIAYVMVNDVLRFITFRLYPGHFPAVYWVTQFLGLLFGSFVIFEIFRVGLRPFPGAAKMARYLLLLVFGAVFAKAVANGSGGFLTWLARTSVEIERDLRMVQALAILTLVILFLYYAIPFGRNLGGIVLGYGLVVLTVILQFTLWYYGVVLRPIWSYVQPVTYFFALALWIWALWSHAPAAATEAQPRLEEDYKVLWMATRNQLERALARLGSVARP